MSIFKKRIKEQFKNDVNQKTKNMDQQIVDNLSIVVVPQTNNQSANIEQAGLQVRMEELSLDFKIDQSNLYEIKDISAITRLNGLFQGGSQQILQSVQNGAIQNTVKSAGALLQSDIPVNQLTRAKGVPNGLRATLMGKKGIERNAVLTKFDSTKITQSGKVIAGVASVMNIASLVVGQYYMGQVNSKLIDINKNLNLIGNYQQREFKSKIMALINNVEEISKFSSEILENHELRKRELHQLNSCKNDTVQLLEQVNITIQEITNENISKFQEYQSKVNEFDKLLGYQRILTAILEEISKLIYTLNLGEVSIKKCFSSYNNLHNHSNESRKLIPEWHQENLINLGIELDNNRLIKHGFEGFISRPLSLIDKKWNYKELESSLKDRINDQRKKKVVEINEPENLFDKDIELIIKEGKYYYIPNRKDKS